MKVESRRTRLGTIPPLVLSHGFRVMSEGPIGENHKVRLSRRLLGGTLEGKREEILLALRPWRRPITDGGVMTVVFWLHESAAMYDALIGDDDDA